MTTSPSTSTAPSAGPTAIKTFSDLGVDARICAALDDASITTPFPIQELTLPLALSGADLIGQARTGTGKTLAFGIPMLQRAEPGKPGVQVLVIVPTRELCLQVTNDLIRAGANLDVSVVACYGGKAIEAQIAALRGGADIVVGTPGRLLDLRNRGDLDLSTVTGLVLDEADEMLDLGFLPDVEQLISATTEGRQTLLFSATMPSAVVSLARRYMTKPTFLRAEVEEVHIAPETEQHFFSCHRMDKPAILARILQTPERGLCVVFSRTKRMADTLAEELRERGIDAAPIHSDLRQDARERALQRFRDGKTTVLVATEVAARGLDIDDVTHVVNYDCPDDEKMYLHRIGRTGRAGAAGVAITLAVWNELARAEMIKRQLAIDVPTHEVFSTSPILDELFQLPARTTKQPRVTAAGARRSTSANGGVATDVARTTGSPKTGSKTEPKVEPTVTDVPAQEERAGGKPRGEGDGRGEGTRTVRRSRLRSRGSRRTEAPTEPDVDAGAGPAPRSAAAEAAEAAEAAAPVSAASAPASDDDAPAIQADATTRRRRRVRRRGSEDHLEAVSQPAVSAATTVVEPDPGEPAASTAATSAATADKATADKATADKATANEATADKATADKATAGDETPGEATGRTRVRRRVRQDQRDEVINSAPSSASRSRRSGPRRAEGDEPEPVQPSPAADSSARNAEAAPKSQDQPTATRGGGDRAGSRRSGGSRAGSNRSNRDRRSTRDSKGTGAPRGGREKSSARASSRGRDADRSSSGSASGRSAGSGHVAAMAKLDTEQLRGNGKPRLDRPMVVTHLP